MTKNLFMCIEILKSDAIYMAIVNNREIIWSHQHTIEFTKNDRHREEACNIITLHFVATYVMNIFKYYI